LPSPDRRGWACPALDDGRDDHGGVGGEGKPTPYDCGMMAGTAMGGGQALPVRPGAGQWPSEES